MSIIEEFQKRKKYKFIGIGIVVLGIIFSGIIGSAFENEVLVYVLGIIFSIPGIIISSFFKCPRCGKHFDGRTPNRNLIYCPRCGVKLMDPDLIPGEPYEGIFPNKDADMWKY